jgi:hypothetical protein
LEVDQVLEQLLEDILIQFQLVKVQKNRIQVSSSPLLDPGAVVGI